ncbi:hypothetical protein GXW82_11750 [Streptacidiphilus sp. 4-A2]|nr:hypothetical protein [Streptacidiphilus sp. 4-A2]
MSTADLSASPFSRSAADLADKIEARTGDPAAAAQQLAEMARTRPRRFFAYSLIHGGERDLYHLAEAEAGREADEEQFERCVHARGDAGAGGRVRERRRAQR